MDRACASGDVDSGLIPSRDRYATKNKLNVEVHYVSENMISALDFGPGLDSVMETCSNRR